MVLYSLIDTDAKLTCLWCLPLRSLRVTHWEELRRSTEDARGRRRCSEKLSWLWISTAETSPSGHEVLFLTVTGRECARRILRHLIPPLDFPSVFITSFSRPSSSSSLLLVWPLQPLLLLEGFFLFFPSRKNCLERGLLAGSGLVMGHSAA